LDCTDFGNENENLFHFIEILILFIFVIEIAAHIIGYGKLYLKDYWNIFDMIVIILSIAFVTLSAVVEN
jgi:hypothetical protein